MTHNALTNAYKHAQASRVDIELSCENSTLKLTVSDDGVGMDPDDSHPAEGQGLRNMQRTASELRGSLEISGEPGKGTVVTLVTADRGEIDGNNADSDRR